MARDKQAAGKTLTRRSHEDQNKVANSTRSRTRAIPVGYASGTYRSAAQSCPRGAVCRFPRLLVLLVCAPKRVGDQHLPSRPGCTTRYIPKLVRHGLSALSSGDVVRFLSHSVCKDGQVRPSFDGEVISGVKRRMAGIRIKHQVHSNSVKAYEKAYTSEGAILRVETVSISANGCARPIQTRNAQALGPSFPQITNAASARVNRENTGPTHLSLD
jgi:hypothetical protein